MAPSRQKKCCCAANHAQNRKEHSAHHLKHFIADINKKRAPRKLAAVILTATMLSAVKTGGRVCFLLASLNSAFRQSETA